MEYMYSLIGVKESSGRYMALEYESLLTGRFPKMDTFNKCTRIQKVTPTPEQ